MTEFRQMHTQAYVVDKVGAPFVLRDVVLDQVQDDEVLVEMRYTGLCHTDIVVQQGGMPAGSYPVVLGHEGAGIVRHVGAAVTDKSLSAGDAVLLSVRNCYGCRPCQDGRIGSCVKATELNFIASRLNDAPSPISLPDGTPVHGQFFGQSSLSKLAVVAQRSVVKVQVPSVERLAPLASMGCGYMTGAGTVLNVLRPTSEDTVAVVGAGAVGFAAIMAARASGAKAVVALDIIEEKLQLALQVGATHAINTSGPKDINILIREVFPDGVDKILDTTGLSFLLNAAFKALAHDGTLALVGVPDPMADVQFNALELLTSVKRVVGVIEGSCDPQQIIPHLVELHQQGKFPVDRIATTYPAASLDIALADLKAGRVIKPVLSW